MIGFDFLKVQQENWQKEKKYIKKRSDLRVYTERDVPRDVPGQTGTGHPVVPLSRDKKVLPVPLSLCPRTRAGANVPGQTPLSRPVPGQNDLKIFKKKDQISHFRTSFLCFRTSFPVLERPFLF